MSKGNRGLLLVVSLCGVAVYGVIRGVPMEQPHSTATVSDASRRGFRGVEEPVPASVGDRRSIEPEGSAEQDAHTRAHTLTIRLCSHLGTPVAGRRILACESHKRLWVAAWSQTDANGVVVVPDVSRWSSAWIWIAGSDSVYVPEIARPAHEETIYLPERAVTGVVQDVVGKRVPGAKIVCSLRRDDVEPWTVVTTTDGAGEFAVEGIWADLFFWAEARGWMPSMRWRAGSEAAQRVVLTLESIGRPFSGTIVDEHGEPVPDATVFAGYSSVVPSERIAQRPAAEVYSNANGSFVFDGVPEARFPLWYGHARFATALRWVEPAEDNVALVMRSGVELEVSTPEGVLSSASIRPIGDLDPPRWQKIVGQMHGANWLFCNVATGEWRVTGRTKSGAVLRRDVEVVQEEGRVSVVLESAGEVLSGRIVDSEGAAWSGLQITHLHESGECRGQTDAEGRFSLPNVRPGGLLLAQCIEGDGAHVVVRRESTAEDLLKGIDLMVPFLQGQFGAVDLRAAAVDEPGSVVLRIGELEVLRWSVRPRSPTSWIRQRVLSNTYRVSFRDVRGLERDLGEWGTAREKN